MNRYPTTAVGSRIRSPDLIWSLGRLHPFWPLIRDARLGALLPPPIQSVNTQAARTATARSTMTAAGRGLRSERERLALHCRSGAAWFAHDVTSPAPRIQRRHKHHRCGRVAEARGGTRPCRHSTGRGKVGEGARQRVGSDEPRERPLVAWG